jgi:hypothetical protein
MTYDMGELTPLLIRKAAKYSGCDSTSIPYEKARRLMAGIIYCIDEYRSDSTEEGLCRAQTLAEQYVLGAEKVREKIDHICRVYNRLAPVFNDYGVMCLSETVNKGIPAFLSRYDAQFFPQDTILTLDYPLLRDMHQLCGADAVDAFLGAVEMEQRFLSAFNEDDIIALLSRCNAGWREMVENICEPVLLNALGHWLLHKPMADRGFRPGEYQRLDTLLREATLLELQEIAEEGIAAIGVRFCPGDEDIQYYLLEDAWNLAVRMSIAAEFRRWDKIFVL